MALFTLLGGFSAWGAVGNLRRWRASLSKPAIPENLGAQDLRAIEEGWPLRQTRWPRPYVNEAWTMEEERAAVYARLAKRQARWMILLGDALAVVGGSWLGVTIPRILHQIAVARKQSVAEVHADSYSPLFFPTGLGEFLTAAFPLFIIVAGFSLKYIAGVFLYMAEWYKKGSLKRERVQSTGPAARPPLVQRLREALRS